MTFAITTTNEALSRTIRRHARASQIVPSLIPLLADSEGRMVRLTALYVLAEFGPDAGPAIETLKTIVEKNVEPLVRHWATFVLGPLRCWLSVFCGVSCLPQRRLL